MLAQAVWEASSSVATQFLRVPPEFVAIWDWTWTHSGELVIAGGVTCLGLAAVSWWLRKGRKWKMSRDKRKNIVDSFIKDGVYYFLLEEKRKGKITPREFLHYVRKYGLINFKNTRKAKGTIMYRLGRHKKQKGKQDYTPVPLPDRVEHPAELRRNTFTTSTRRRAFRRLEQILSTSR